MDLRPIPEYITAAVLVFPGVYRNLLHTVAHVECEAGFVTSCRLRMLVPGMLGEPHEAFIMTKQEDNSWQTWCEPCWRHYANGVQLW